MGTVKAVKISYPFHEEPWTSRNEVCGLSKSRCSRASPHDCYLGATHRSPHTLYLESTFLLSLKLTPTNRGCLTSGWRSRDNPLVCGITRIGIDVKPEGTRSTSLFMCGAPPKLATSKGGSCPESSSSSFSRRYTSGTLGELNAFANVKVFGFLFVRFKLLQGNCSLVLHC